MFQGSVLWLGLLILLGLGVMLYFVVRKRVEGKELRSMGGWREQSSSRSL
jgi:hypothetical protein